MRVFIQIFLFLAIVSCSYQENELKETEIQLEIVKGPFLIRNGFLYKQDTNELVNGVVEIYNESSDALSEKKEYINGLLNGNYDIFLDTGQLISRTIYVDGKKNGVYERFYSSGQLREQSVYKNDKKVDVEKLYDKYGNLYEKIHYDKSTSDIDFVETYENSVLTGWFDYQNGSKTGPYKIYRNNSILKESGNYLYGYKNGIIKFYNEKQELESEIDYLNEIEIGSKTYYYYDDGSLKSIIERRNNENDNFKVFQGSGDLLIDLNLKPTSSLTLDGIQKGYYRNGNLKFIRNYNEGNIEINLSTHYDKDGNEIEDGTIFEYYDDSNAQLRYEYEIKNGMRNGFIQFWHPDGTIRARGFYKDGNVLDGFEKYSENGIVDNEKTLTVDSEPI